MWLALLIACDDGPSYRWVPQWTCVREEVLLDDDEPLDGIAPSEVVARVAGDHDLAAIGPGGIDTRALVTIERGEGEASGLRARLEVTELRWERPSNAMLLAYPICASHIIVPMRATIASEDGSVDVVVRGEAEAEAPAVPNDATYETTLSPASLRAPIDADDVVAVPAPREPGAELHGVLWWAMEPSEPPGLSVSVHFDGDEDQRVLQTL